MCFEEGFKHCQKVLCNLINIGGIGRLLVHIAIPCAHGVVHKENVCHLYPTGGTGTQVHVKGTNLLEVTKSCRRPSRSTLNE